MVDICLGRICRDPSCVGPPICARMRSESVRHDGEQMRARQMRLLAAAIGLVINKRLVQG